MFPLKKEGEEFFLWWEARNPQCIRETPADLKFSIYIIIYAYVSFLGMTHI